MTSPDFRLCSHLWKLKIYPRGYQEDGPAHFAASLTCIGTPPNEKVTYQLWLQKHKDPAKTAARGSERLMVQGASYGYPHLASHEQVFEPDNGFLREKTITMGVHISLIAKEDAETCPEYPSVTKCFAPFYDDPETSDILVKAGDKEIHAHKIILSAQSALFGAMFQDMALPLAYITLH